MQREAGGGGIVPTLSALDVAPIFSATPPAAYGAPLDIIYILSAKVKVIK